MSKVKQRMQETGWTLTKTGSYGKRVVSGSVLVKFDEEGNLTQIAAQLWNERKWLKNEEISHTITNYKEASNIEQVYPMIARLGVFQYGENPFVKRVEQEVKQELKKPQSEGVQQQMF